MNQIFVEFVSVHKAIERIIVKFMLFNRKLSWYSIKKSFLAEAVIIEPTNRSGSFLTFGFMYVPIIEADLLEALLP